MKILGLTLAAFSASLLISASAMLYCQVRLFYWFEHHRPSQGMPYTLDMQIADFIAQPAYWIKRNCDN